VCGVFRPYREVTPTPLVPAMQTSEPQPVS
jgi:hypothetical protein